MRMLNSPIPSLVALSTGLLLGCERVPDDWSPVLEETSTTFLETETARALERIQEVEDHLQSDPGRAEAALGEAKMALVYLRDFYLPLFQARERAYNAYRYHRLGEGARVDRELELIEETLGSMAETAGGGPNAELQALAELVAAARIAAKGSPAEAESALEALARRFEQVVVKGDLIVGSG